MKLDRHLLKKIQTVCTNRTIRDSATQNEGKIRTLSCTVNGQIFFSLIEYNSFIVLIVYSIKRHLNNY